MVQPFSLAIDLKCSWVGRWVYDEKCTQLTPRVLKWSLQVLFGGLDSLRDSIYLKDVLDQYYSDRHVFRCENTRIYIYIYLRWDNFEVDFYFLKTKNNKKTPSRLSRLLCATTVIKSYQIDQKENMFLIIKTICFVFL